MENYPFSRVLRPASGLIALAILLYISLSTTGCGSSGTPTNSSQSPLEIISEPASQTVPLGLTATFTVQAVGGTGSLRYQWSENGTAISGATAASYTTSATQLSDNGSLYTVVVSDQSTSVDSNHATLTIGARSPKAGDLRFQQVDAPAVADEGDTASTATGEVEISCASCDHTSATFSPATAAPLELSTLNDNCNSDCAWRVLATWLPPAKRGFPCFTPAIQSSRSTPICLPS